MAPDTMELAIHWCIVSRLKFARECSNKVRMVS